MSNPIVTPVTDEFPTEDDAKTKMTLMMTVAENPEPVPGKGNERKEEQVEDYGARKRKRGKEVRRLALEDSSKTLTKTSLF